MVVLEGATVAAAGKFCDLEGRFKALFGLDKADADGAAGAALPLAPPSGSESPSVSANNDGAPSKDAAAATAAAMGGPRAEDDATDEAYAKGAVSQRHLWRYIRSCGPAFMLASLGALFIGQQVLTVAAAWWIAKWTSASTASGPSPVFFASVYAGINGGVALATLGRSLLTTYGSLRASTVLHNAALLAVLHAPAGWFARTPAGRISNRFLADVSAIDNQLSASLSSFLTIVLQIVAVVAVLAAFTPIVIALMAALAVIYVRVGQLYRVNARDLRRLSSTTKSPILSHFTEVLRGLSVIRAFGPAAATAVVERHLHFCRENSEKKGKGGAGTYMRFLSRESLRSSREHGLHGRQRVGVDVARSRRCGSHYGHLRLLRLGVWARAPQRIRGRLCVVVLHAGALRLRSLNVVEATLLSLVQVPSLLMWLVRRFTLVEQDSVSVERLSEFAEMPSEEAAEAGSESNADATVVDSDRKAEGDHSTAADIASREVGRSAELVVSDLWLRYSPALPWVLRGLSLRIPAGAKVAVLGTTGCGKSTTFQGLLRFYAAERGSVQLLPEGGGGEGSAVDLRRLSCAAARAHIAALLQVRRDLAGR